MLAKYKVSSVMGSRRGTATLLAVKSTSHSSLEVNVDKNDATGDVHDEKVKSGDGY